MSSARRLQDDYRRILGITEDTRGLDDALPRMRIGAQRGIFMIGSGEIKSGSAGSEADPDDPTSGEEPVMPDENQDNQNDDGSGGGNVTIDPPQTDGDDFIIDPDAPTNTPVDDVTFGDNWASGGPSRFIDCETEQCIELVEVGGYVPPEGWDDADTPPIDPDYEQGFFWELSTNPYVCGQTRDITFNKLPSGFSRNNVSLKVSGAWVKYDVGRGSTPTSCENNNANIKIGSTCFIGGQVANFTKRACGINSGCGCDDPPPIPDHWPSDNCIQLTPNAQGNWQASPRENPNDMTAKYSEAKSVLNLCNSAGESVEVYPRRGGGYVYFNADQGIWAASDASGRKRSFGSSSTLNQEIARG